MWRTIDTQEQLDLLNASVDWNESRVLAFCGGSSTRSYFPPEVRRRVYDRLNVHILLATASEHGDLLELCFIRCDRIGGGLMDQLRLCGRVNEFCGVELVAADGRRVVACERLLTRWRSLDDSNGVFVSLSDDAARVYATG
jgi:hypothetical protein